MKKYITPKIEYVDLRLEERVAGSVCNGACVEDVIYNGVKYIAGQDPG